MTWRVALADAESREFLDLVDIGGRYYRLEPGFLEKLQTRVKHVPHYHLRVGAIQSIEGLKGSGESPFILLLVTLAGLAVTFLGCVSENGGGRIVGVWPAQFRSVLETDKQAVMNLLYIAVERPEAVRHLELVF
jgi:hypothetical protein